MDRLTYRSGGRAYLKGGLDGAWKMAGGYDKIQAATEKLAMYEEREEFETVSVENMKAIMAERDEYKAQYLYASRLLANLQEELLGNSDAMNGDVIVEQIIAKYGKRNRGLFIRFKKKGD